MGNPNISTLLKSFWRTYFIGAIFNTKGLQNLGLAYAMDPGLKTIYKDQKRLNQARKRYVELYNTHPYWTPFLVGYFLFLESKIAKGLIAPESLTRIKNTVSYTLSAIGDSFFGGSLLVFWSLVEVQLLFFHFEIFGLLWMIFSLLILQGFKFITFWFGWTRGLSFFQWLKQVDLINWGKRLKLINSVLLLFFWYNILPVPRTPFFFATSTSALGVGAFLVFKNIVKREIIFIIFAGGLLLWSFWIM